jgi:hypothetical protein
MRYSAGEPPEKRPLQERIMSMMTGRVRHGQSRPSRARPSGEAENESPNHLRQMISSKPPMRKLDAKKKTTVGCLDHRTLVRNGLDWSCHGVFELPYLRSLLLDKGSHLRSSTQPLRSSWAVKNQERNVLELHQEWHSN